MHHHTSPDDLERALATQRAVGPQRMIWPDDRESCGAAFALRLAMPPELCCPHEGVAALSGRPDRWYVLARDNPAVRWCGDCLPADIRAALLRPDTVAGTTRRCDCCGRTGALGALSSISQQRGTVLVVMCRACYARDFTQDPLAGRAS